MGKRLAVYSDILEKMTLGLDEYIAFYTSKVKNYQRLSELKSKYENAKNGYEASLMINYDKDSKDFHSKNISKIKTEITVLKQNLYPIIYSNNKIKSTFQKLFFIPYAKKNKGTSARLSDLESRLKKSQEAFDFYNNKFELGSNYLKMLGFENSRDVASIKRCFDNTVLEFNTFIDENSKYFEGMDSRESFYKAGKSQIEDNISTARNCITSLSEIRSDFEARRGSLANVIDAKKLLTEINQKITKVINE